MTEGPFQSKPLKDTDAPEATRPELHHVLDALRIGNVELANQLLARVSKTGVRTCVEFALSVLALSPGEVAPRLRMERSDEFDLGTAYLVHVIERVTWFKLENDCALDVERAFQSFLESIKSAAKWGTRIPAEIVLLDSLSTKIEEHGFGFWSISWKQKVANR